MTHVLSEFTTTPRPASTPMNTFWRCPTCKLIFCLREEFRVDEYVICKCCGGEWVVPREGTPYLIHDPKRETLSAARTSSTKASR